MHPPIRFVTTSDGVRIAYCTHGDGPPLVFVRGWISHLEMLWDDPAFRSYFEALAQHHLVVRYDARGNGLSDRALPEFDLDGFVLDLESVIDELELTDVVLYGATFGGPIAIAYAARHPDRVSKLILDGTYARGEGIAGPERQASIIATLTDLPEAGLLLLSHLTHPEPESQHTPYRRPERLRQAISPDVAAQLYALAFRTDVSALLPEIRVPTLVLHRRGSYSIPFALARELASQVPGVRFVSLRGTAHNSWEGDAMEALTAVADFLGIELELTPQVGVDRGQAPLTILFTDIEGSTGLTQRLGDDKAQEVLRTHNTIVREALNIHGGTEIKHTGDGIMASFPSASHAIACAVGIQDAITGHNQENSGTPIRVRIGLNAGEPVAENEDLFGTAVQLAARICDYAEPGQILASEVVRGLVAGKRFRFVGRGEVVLKGFEEPQRLYEVRVK
jgi:class 3 adenylate cyclase